MGQRRLSKIPNVKGTAPEPISPTDQELEDMIRAEADDEASVALISGAEFGTRKNEKGNLRHNGNVRRFHAMVIDHDAGTLSIAEGRRLLQKNGINAVLHSTKRSTPDCPRWRGILPFDKPVKPAVYPGLVRAVDNVLGGGVLARESSTLAQFFFIGRVRGAPEPQLEFAKGGWSVDSVLPPIKDAPSPEADTAAPKTSKHGPLAKHPDDVAAVVSAIPNDAAANWPFWTEIGLLISAATGHSEDGFSIYDEWSQQHSTYDPKATRQRWNDFRRSPATEGGFGKLVFLAQQADPTFQLPSRIADHIRRFNDDEPRSTSSGERLRLLTPDQCAAEERRGYIVKGLIAPGDMCAIIGHPGAGKSLVGPDICYAVAQGRAWHGHRVKQGPTFYIAAEDARGMQQRVCALREHHGDAPAFRLVIGAGDLLDDDAVEEIEAHIEAERPSIIVIDTLAAAFAGLDENESGDMGRVVATARRLTKHGAAVVLIHHVAKSGAASPRGHSILNGALDLCLVVEREPESDDPRVVEIRQTKNRNGDSTKNFAFRIETRVIGTDEDGDPISVALAAEIEAGERVAVSRLTPGEAAALSVLQDEGGAMAEGAFRDACRSSGRVSSSLMPNTVWRAVDRAVKGLARKHRLIIAEGRVTLAARAEQVDRFKDEDL